MTHPWTRRSIRFAASCALGALLMTSAQATRFTPAPPKVQISQGELSGKLADGVRAYLGVPYAAPPVGELRWQSPQPPADWSGTRDGRAFRDRCAQPLSFLSPKSVNEDCLYLNVHVPDDIGGEKLPVMVWIHGGAFLSGAAADYDMVQLARKARAVVVSINYRLGAFGFFRAPELAAQHQSSNLGLQDQQAALRWVQSQIGQFGGDASRVTLFGHSAGGASVCLHTVSPQSQGLFQRAIMQSGTCGLLTSTPPEAMAAQSARLGVQLGCPNGPGQLACLRDKPAAEVLKASVPNGNEVKDVEVRWAPVRDGVTLLEDPGQQVRQGRFHRVPMMIGTTRDEGDLFVGTEYHLAAFRTIRQADVEFYIGQIAGSDTSRAAQLRSTYAAQAYGSLDRAFSALLTDYFFSCDSLQETQAFSRQVPTYTYEFSETGLPFLFQDPLMRLGSLHGAELIFLFQSSKQTWPMLFWNKAQKQLSDQLIGYWGRFAATGNPNGPHLPSWPAFSSQRDSILNIRSSGNSVLGTAEFRQSHQCNVFDPS
ncbi:carboxylesterase family protein [Aquabacterium soli]|uniref:Carboxylic ester hydrolase n=1 Tax=Aquabacterium soli TaxID=2493092 RepID=A0A426VBK8_9BURK|nr:carboxylesterase/lipase family protein [Aquabacterium soli]RRS04108.1 carboxylesterase family protein [Aquabacterium soli]